MLHGTWKIAVGLFARAGTDMRREVYWPSSSRCRWSHTVCCATPTLRRTPNALDNEQV